jgi:hypothetical protein
VAHKTRAVPASFSARCLLTLVHKSPTAAFMFAAAMAVALLAGVRLHSASGRRTGSHDVDG